MALRGATNILIGAKDTAVEMGQMARDVGNTTVAGGSIVTNKTSLADVYVNEMHSKTFGGFD